MNNSWISISDLMSGLMMVFLFIAISFMLEVNNDKESIKNVKTSLNKILKLEFKDDLDNWNAEITENNIIRFYSPKILFKGGVSHISHSFKDVLNNFFPRYIKILTSKKYKSFIDEIRIEGHTSNDWGNETSKKLIYIKNMELSQKRALNVLKYCYKIKNMNILSNLKWLETRLRANGMSFSKPIYTKSGEEDIEKEKRVEIRTTLLYI